MPFSQKNRLPCRNQSGYISAAPHKTGAGIGTPQTNRAHNRASGFFVRAVSPRLFRVRIMVGRTGPASAGPGPLLAGSSNPVRLTTLYSSAVFSYLADDLRELQQLIQQQNQLH